MRIPTVVATKSLIKKQGDVLLVFNDQAKGTNRFSFVKQTSTIFTTYKLILQL